MSFKLPPPRKSVLTPREQAVESRRRIPTPTNRTLEGGDFAELGKRINLDLAIGGGYEGLLEARAKDQGIGELSAKFLGNVAGTLVFETLKMPGYLAELGSISDGIDNFYLKGIRDLQEATQGEFATVHTPPSITNSESVADHFNRYFLAGDLANGVGFLASFLIPGQAVKALGLGAKAAGKLSRAATKIIQAAETPGRYGQLLLKGAARTGRGINFGTLAGKIDSSLAVGINTYLESAAEASELYHNLLAQGVDQAEAGAKSAQAFKANLGLLMISNAIVESYLFKGFGRMSPTTPTLQKLGDAVFKGKTPKFSTLGQAGKALRGTATGIAQEGFFEEGMQNVIQQVSEEKDKFGITDVLKTYGDNVRKMFSGDIEAVDFTKSVVLGGLLGAPMSAIGAARDYRDQRDFLLGRQKSEPNKLQKFFGVEGKAETKGAIELLKAEIDTFKSSGLGLLKDGKLDVKKVSDNGQLQIVRQFYHDLVLKHDGDTTAASKEFLDEMGEESIILLHTFGIPPGTPKEAALQLVRAEQDVAYFSKFLHLEGGEELLRAHLEDSVDLMAARYEEHTGTKMSDQQRQGVLNGMMSQLDIVKTQFDKARKTTTRFRAANKLTDEQTQKLNQALVNIGVRKAMLEEHKALMLQGTRSQRTPQNIARTAEVANVTKELGKQYDQLEVFGEPKAEEPQRALGPGATPLGPETVTTEIDEQIDELDKTATRLQEDPLNHFAEWELTPEQKAIALKVRKENLERDKAEERTILERQLEFTQQLGRQVEVNGHRGELRKINDNRYEVVSDDQVYEFTVEDLREKNFRLLEKDYKVENLTEQEVTVNGVPYEIVLNEMGNVVGLRPANNLDQVLTNERLLVAVEIARNQLAYQKATPEVTKGVELDEEIIERIWAVGMTDEIAEILDEILTMRYNEKWRKLKYSDDRLLDFGIWLETTIKRVEDLRSPYNDAQTRDIINQALHTLDILQSVIDNNELQRIKSKKQSRAKTTKVSGTTQSTQRSEATSSKTETPAGSRVLQERIDNLDQRYEQKLLDILQEELNNQNKLDAIELTWTEAERFAAEQAGLQPQEEVEINTTPFAQEAASRGYSANDTINVEFDGEVFTAKITDQGIEVNERGTLPNMDVFKTTFPGYRILPKSNVDPEVVKVKAVTDKIDALLTTLQDINIKLRGDNIQSTIDLLAQRKATIGALQEMLPQLDISLTGDNTDSLQTQLDLRKDEIGRLQSFIDQIEAFEGQLNEAYERQQLGMFFLGKELPWVITKEVANDEDKRVRFSGPLQIADVQRLVKHYNNEQLRQLKVLREASELPLQDESIAAGDTLFGEPLTVELAFGSKPTPIKSDSSPVSQVVPGSDLGDVSRESLDEAFQKGKLSNHLLESTGVAIEYDAQGNDAYELKDGLEIPIVARSESQVRWNLWADNEPEGFKVFVTPVYYTEQDGIYEKYYREENPNHQRSGEDLAVLVTDQQGNPIYVNEKGEVVNEGYPLWRFIRLPETKFKDNRTSSMNDLAIINLYLEANGLPPMSNRDLAETAKITDASAARKLADITGLTVDEVRKREFRTITPMLREKAFDYAKAQYQKAVTQLRTGRQEVELIDLTKGHWTPIKENGEVKVWKPDFNQPHDLIKSDSKGNIVIGTSREGGFTPGVVYMRTNDDIMPMFTDTLDESQVETVWQLIKTFVGTRTLKRSTANLNVKYENSPTEIGGQVYEKDIPILPSKESRFSAMTSIMSWGKQGGKYDIYIQDGILFFGDQQVAMDALDSAEVAVKNFLVTKYNHVSYPLLAEARRNKTFTYPRLSYENGQFVLRDQVYYEELHKMLRAGEIPKQMRDKYRLPKRAQRNLAFRLPEPKKAKQPARKVDVNNPMNKYYLETVQWIQQNKPYKVTPEILVKRLKFSKTVAEKIHKALIEKGIIDEQANPKRTPAPKKAKASQAPQAQSQSQADQTSPREITKRLLTAMSQGKPIAELNSISQELLAFYEEGVLPNARLYEDQASMLFDDLKFKYQGQEKLIAIRMIAMGIEASGLGRSQVKTSDTLSDEGTLVPSPTTETPPGTPGIVNAALGKQGRSISFEIVGKTGKEFLLTMEYDGKLDLFPEKGEDGLYRSSLDYPTVEQRQKLYDTYVPENIRKAVDTWIKSHKGSYAAPESEDGKAHLRAVRELENLLNVASGIPVFSEVDEKLLGEETVNVYFGTNENPELSNFAKRPFSDNKASRIGKLYTSTTAGKPITWNTVEGAFQAEKLLYTEPTSSYFNKDGTLSDEGIKLVEALANASGATAKKLGRQIKGLYVEDWNNASEEIMRYLIHASFVQNPEAASKLLATGNKRITHIQDKWKWGKLFPKVLMEVRQNLRGVTSGRPIPSTETTEELLTTKPKRPAISLSKPTLKKNTDLRLSDKLDYFLKTNIVKTTDC